MGSFRPNRLGLHDMLGNLTEWVDDCYGEYEGAPTDGLSLYAGDCSYRVLRGGDFLDGPVRLRSADRVMGSAGDRYGFRGFRVARRVR